VDLFENVDITTRVGPIGTSYISKIGAKLDKMQQPAQSWRRLLVVAKHWFYVCFTLFYMNFLVIFSQLFFMFL